MMKDVAYSLKIHLILSLSQNQTQRMLNRAPPGGHLMKSHTLQTGRSLGHFSFPSRNLPHQSRCREQIHQLTWSLKITYKEWWERVFNLSHLRLLGWRLRLVVLCTIDLASSDICLRWRGDRVNVWRRWDHVCCALVNRLLLLHWCTVKRVGNWRFSKDRYYWRRHAAHCNWELWLFAARCVTGSSCFFKVYVASEDATNTTRKSALPSRRNCLMIF